MLSLEAYIEIVLLVWAHSRLDWDQDFEWLTSFLMCIYSVHILKYFWPNEISNRSSKRWTHHLRNICLPWTLSSNHSRSHYTCTDWISCFLEWLVSIRNTFFVLCPILKVDVLYFAASLWCFIWQTQRWYFIVYFNGHFLILAKILIQTAKLEPTAYIETTALLSRQAPVLRLEAPPPAPQDGRLRRSYRRPCGTPGTC